MQTGPVRLALLAGAVELAAGATAWAGQGGAPGRQSAAGSAAERTDAGLKRKLVREVSVEWKAAPLKSVLHDLAASGGFTVLLDRRVDPDRPVSLELHQVTIEEGLRRLTAGEKLGLSLFGPLVYVGPPEAAARLRTLAVLRGADVMQVPRNIRPVWLTAAPWSWPRFSAPRELMEQLARQAAIKLSGLDRVPHDLWPEAELPPLSVADRLTLLAAAFDLTYRLAADGRSAELVPIPRELKIERRYPAGTRPAELAERWRARVPAAQISVDGNQLVVHARIEEHEQLKVPATARPTVSPGSSDPELVRIARLEFKEVPLGQVIEGLARQLEMRVEMDRAGIERTGVSLDKPISLDLHNATIDQVWHAVVDPLGLRYERQGRVVHIRPSG